MQTRTVDSKGRITLGERFANRTVMIDDIDETEVRVTLARVIPEREAWLYDNQQASRAVGRGLQQAKAHEFVEGPNLDDDAALADQIEDGD